MQLSRLLAGSWLCILVGLQSSLCHGTESDSASFTERPILHLPNYTRAYDYLRIYGQRERNCEPLDQSLNNFCQGFEYGSVQMPNILNHQTQRDAKLQLDGLSSLMFSSCSRELPFLMCSVYFPMCRPTIHGRIGEEAVDLTTPCRSMCERVRSRCEPVLGRFALSWPRDLNCSMLQEEAVMFGPDSEISTCVDRPPNNYQPPHPSSQPCPTRTCSKPLAKKTTFKKAKYHFGIVGLLRDTIISNGRKSFHIVINETLGKCKQGVIPRHLSRLLRAGIEALLITGESDMCGCPHLAPNHLYIFTGWVSEDGRFVISTSSLIRSTTAKLKKKVKKWVRKYCPTPAQRT